MPRVMERLGEVASQQWGLITTAQAAAQGVGRLQLSRLAETGSLDRVQRGVYRTAGSPVHDLEHTCATWLALGGAAGRHEKVPPLVASGTTASTVHRIGDFLPGEEQFDVPRRKTTRLPGVRLRIRQHDPIDVTYVDALPVLTVEATIADLLQTWGDLSLVARVAADAVEQHKIVRPARLEELLTPLAEAGLIPTGQGRHVWQELQVIAGLR